MLIIGTRTNDATKGVTLDVAGLLHHTLIAGQSGSGKSFFVARLIEEIVLNTLGRVVMVDANGDFRSIASPSTTAFETHSDAFAAIRKVRASNTPTFDDQQMFSSAWGERRFLNLYPNTAVLPQDRPEALNRRLVVHWEALEEED
jgi:ABC-type glutathione transport system ATPase component